MGSENFQAALPRWRTPSPPPPSRRVSRVEPVARAKGKERQKPSTRERVDELFPYTASGTRLIQATMNADDHDLDGGSRTKRMSSGGSKRGRRVGEVCAMGSGRGKGEQAWRWGFLSLIRALPRVSISRWTRASSLLPMLSLVGGCFFFPPVRVARSLSLSLCFLFE